MAYGDGPKFGMISDGWIYDIGDAGTIGDKFRNKLSIDKTAEIPWTHFIARIKAGHIKRKNLKMSRSAIKYMRRFQAQKIILDAINNNSSVYGDQIKSRSKLSTKEIQEMITKENLSSTYNDSPYESDNITKYNKFIALKTAVSRGLWEKIYINRFKFKAFRKYNKKSRRDRALIDINHEIKYHRELLHNHLFHNYNIAAINCGKLKKADGYAGLFPDKIDMDIAEKYAVSDNKKSNTRTTSENTKENEKVTPTKVESVNVNQNKNNNSKENTKATPAKVESVNVNQNKNNNLKETEKVTPTKVESANVNQNKNNDLKETEKVTPTKVESANVNQNKNNDAYDTHKEIPANYNQSKLSTVNSASRKYSAEWYNMPQEGYDELVAEGFTPGTEEFHQELVRTGMAKLYKPKWYSMSQEGYDELVAEGFTPGTKEFDQELMRNGMGTPIQTSRPVVNQESQNEKTNEFRTRFTSNNSKIDSKGIELLEMLDDYNSINHSNDENNINKGMTR